MNVSVHLLLSHIVKEVHEPDFMVFESIQLRMDGSKTLGEVILMLNFFNVNNGGGEAYANSPICASALSALSLSLSLSLSSSLFRGILTNSKDSSLGISPNKLLVNIPNFSFLKE